MAQNSNGVYTVDDPLTPVFGTDEDDPAKQLAGIMSPAPAHALVAPPPNTAPKADTSQTTPQTGSLAYAPTQATPKVSGLPMQPGRAALPEEAAVQPVSPIGALQPARPMSGIQPAQPIQPAQTKLQQDQARLAELQAQPAGGAQIHNKFGSIAARIGDIAGSWLEPGLTQFVKGSTLNKEREVGIQQGVVNSDQGQLKAAADLSDTQSQQRLREEEAAKNAALAEADKPITLSPDQAQQEGHPEWANVPLTQRTLGLLRSTAIKGKTAETVGAGHDAAGITRTGMKDATSSANNAASNASRETIAAARDKTQMLLGRLRSATSTGNSIRAHSADANGNYKVPAQITNRASLSSNVMENADAVEQIVRDHPDIVGPGNGTVSSVEQMIGSDDPNLQALGVRMHNIALASNGAHGLRSAEAVKATEDELFRNFRTGPHGLKGGLDAMRSSVQTFLDDEKNFRKTGGRVAPAQPPGAIKPATPAGGFSWDDHPEVKQ